MELDKTARREKNTPLNPLSRGESERQNSPLERGLRGKAGRHARVSAVLHGNSAKTQISLAFDKAQEPSVQSQIEEEDFLFTTKVRIKYLKFIAVSESQI